MLIEGRRLKRPIKDERVWPVGRRRNGGDMSITEKPPGLLTPDQLRQMSQEAEMAKAREAIAKAEKAEKEQAELHEAFMKWEIGNDALERVMKLVQRSALDGEHKVFLFKFPASYCTDHGRAINNFEPSWPEFGGNCLIKPFSLFCWLPG